MKQLIQVLMSGLPLCSVGLLAACGDDVDLDRDLACSDCHDPQAESEDPEDADVPETNKPTSTHRDDVIHALQGQPEDYVCFDLDYPCANPESAILQQDGEPVWGWAPRPDDADEAPISACIHPDAIPEGPHTYTFLTSCDGLGNAATGGLSTTQRSIPIRGLSEAAGTGFE